MKKKMESLVLDNSIDLFAGSKFLLYTLLQLGFVNLEGTRKITHPSLLLKLDKLFLNFNRMDFRLQTEKLQHCTKCYSRTSFNKGRPFNLDYQERIVLWVTWIETGVNDLIRITSDDWMNKIPFETRK